MDVSCDVAIIGGAFSGAATGCSCEAEKPGLRILVIEKAAEFDRKVGESTTEVSSCFLTRVLGLPHYLGHHHLAKQGLRMWFTDDGGAFDGGVRGDRGAVQLAASGVPGGSGDAG